MDDAQPTRSSERFAFLGREFLTWLWFESARNQGMVDATNVGAVRVEFGQRLVLESSGNIREGSTVSAEAPHQTEEARTALRVGKKVTRARLILELGERQFQLGIDAESLTFSGVKLPTTLEGKDDQRLDERLRLLDELEAVVDDLYLTFVNLRRDTEAWGRVREDIRTWVLADVQD
jgi:hypothetical protein